MYKEYVEIRVDNIIKDTSYFSGLFNREGYCYQKWNAPIIEQSYFNGQRAIVRYENFNSYKKDRFPKAMIFEKITCCTCIVAHRRRKESEKQLHICSRKSATQRNFHYERNT